MTSAESDSAIRQAVERIAARFHPHRIILFGSWARGQGRPDSDADLLVVMPATSNAAL